MAGDAAPVLGQLVVTTKAASDKRSDNDRTYGQADADQRSGSALRGLSECQSGVDSRHQCDHGKSEKSGAISKSKRETHRLNSPKSNSWIKGYSVGSLSVNLEMPSLVLPIEFQVNARGPRPSDLRPPSRVAIRSETSDPIRSIFSSAINSSKCRWPAPCVAAFRHRRSPDHVLAYSREHAGRPRILDLARALSQPRLREKQG